MKEIKFNATAKKERELLLMLQVLLRWLLFYHWSTKMDTLKFTL
jgi:hypothetical protein